MKCSVFCTILCFMCVNTIRHKNKGKGGTCQFVSEWKMDKSCFNWMGLTFKLFKNKKKVSRRRPCYVFVSTINICHRFSKYLYTKNHIRTTQPHFLLSCVLHFWPHFVKILTYYLKSIWSFCFAKLASEDLVHSFSCQQKFCNKWPAIF